MRCEGGRRRDSTVDQMQRSEKIVKFASSSCLNAEGAPPRYKQAAVSGLSSLCDSVRLRWKNVLTLHLGPLNLKQCDAFVVFVSHYPENPKMTTRASTWLHAPSVTFCSWTATNDAFVRSVQKNFHALYWLNDKMQVVFKALLPSRLAHDCYMQHNLALET